MEDELFNIVLNPMSDGQIVFGAFEWNELPVELKHILDLLAKSHDPGHTLDGLEIVRCVKPKDAEDAEK